MNTPSTATPQTRGDPLEVARISALPQDAQPTQRTVLSQDGSMVNITTDKSGRVTITKSGGAASAGVGTTGPAEMAAEAPPLTEVFTTTAPTRGDLHGDELPAQVVELAWGFLGMCLLAVVGWPIARALGRRIERGAATPAVEPAVAAQLVRIEQAVEAMAIEVERISESQRFMAKIQSQSSAERV